MRMIILASCVASMVGVVGVGCAAEGRGGRPIEVLDGISVEAPGFGESVSMEVVYDDGNTELVTVTIGEDDVPNVVHHNGFGLPPGASAACAKKCDDDSYSHLGFAWQEQLEWRYRDAGRPSGTKANAIAAIKHGIAGVTTSRDACGLDDEVTAKHGYLGSTSKGPNIDKNGCKASDGTNSMGWRALGGNVLGVACVWSIGNEAVEADIAFAKTHAWFLGNTKPDICNNRFSLRAVATHEAGHAFGLGHSGCAQAMAPSVQACNGANRRLGRGDVEGLRALYTPSP